MTYEEMKELECPVCGEHMTNVPGRFKFDVKDSQRTRRQTLEGRFKRREKRIQRQYTPQQQEGLARLWKRLGCKATY